MDFQVFNVFCILSLWLYLGFELLLFCFLACFLSIIFSQCVSFFINLWLVLIEESLECWCMAKPIQYCKVKKNNNNNKINFKKRKQRIIHLQAQGKWHRKWHKADRALLPANNHLCLLLNSFRWYSHSWHLGPQVLFWLGSTNRASI